MSMLSLVTKLFKNRTLGFPSTRFFSRFSSAKPSSSTKAQQMQPHSLHVVIVGAGIGGLSCAIACRRATPPIRVTVVERTPELLGIGAGIHIPPNACRIVTHLGLNEKLRQAKAYEVQDFTLRRYQTGDRLVEKPLNSGPNGGRCRETFGSEWLAIHRGDYQDVLLRSAEEAGANLILDAEVSEIIPPNPTSGKEGQELVRLKDGRQFQANVVVGADGLWSLCRDHVLEHHAPPQETGHLAFRGTFSREHLSSFQDPRIDGLMKASNIQVWIGPDQHAVFYPLRDHTEYNLVLICSDDLPANARTAHGSLEEMRRQFVGWDPVLNKIISCLGTALKWKLMHFKELDTWTRGVVALLGDASHPTLPYQGQGAAMAVEDGAVIGLLLDKLQQNGLFADPKLRRHQIYGLLRLYEDLRKKRTEVNVAGAELTRELYHLADGERQRARDEELAALHRSDWTGPSEWNWADAEYQKSLLGFDVLADAEKKFELWWSGKARL